jgi:hypothetical protein
MTNVTNARRITSIFLRSNHLPACVADVRERLKPRAVPDFGRVPARRLEPRACDGAIPASAGGGSMRRTGRASPRRIGGGRGRRTRAVEASRSLRGFPPLLPRVHSPRTDPSAARLRRRDAPPRRRLDASDAACLAQVHPHRGVAGPREQLKPRAVCEAFRRRCREFTRPGRNPAGRAVAPPRTKPPPGGPGGGFVAIPRNRRGRRVTPPRGRRRRRPARRLPARRSPPCATGAGGPSRRWKAA